MARHLPSRALLLLTLCAGGGAAHAVTVKAVANLVGGSCNILLDNGADKVRMRGGLAKEFDTTQTASIIPFQMVVQACNGTQVGHKFSVKVTGRTLTLSPEQSVFNEDPSEDVGFMIKENGKSATNYWPGSKDSFYSDAGTVANGDTSQQTELTEDTPMFTTLNYFVGLVTPKGGGGGNPAPRHLQANIMFDVIYN